MTRARWDELLKDVEKAHRGHPDMQAFCPFPDDVTPQDVDAFHIPPSTLLQAETGLDTDRYAALRDGFVALSPAAHWRETYKGTDIGQDFMDRFGCYCLIGTGGAFASQKVWAWMVYMPAHLHYPWHHHPGEEIYLTLAGEAEFYKEGEPPRVLRPGQVSVHASNQPHAMTTQSSPVMALVMWRNGFDTPPVLTPDEPCATSP